MRKVAGVTFILVMIVAFQGISLGDPLERGVPPAYFSQDLDYSRWLLRQKGNLPLSSYERAESGNSLYYNPPIEAVSEQEFSLKPEVKNSRRSRAPAQNKDFSYFENGHLLKEKSSYDFGKIRLAGSNMDSSSNFLPSLCVAKYKEENTISWALERFKQSDIFKSLAILLELKINF